MDMDEELILDFEPEQDQEYVSTKFEPKTDEVESEKDFIPLDAARDPTREELKVHKTPMDVSLDEIIQQKKIWIPTDALPRKHFNNNKGRQGGGGVGYSRGNGDHENNMPPPLILKPPKRVMPDLKPIVVGTQFQDSKVKDEPPSPPVVAGEQKVIGPLMNLKPSAGIFGEVDPRALRNLQAANSDGIVGYFQAMTSNLMRDKYNMNIQNDIRKEQGKKFAPVFKNSPITVQPIEGIDVKLASLGTKTRLNTRFA